MRDLLKSHIHERFVVTLKGGETFSGLLDRRDKKLMVLVGVEMISEHALPQGVAGELFIQWVDVAYIQRLP